MTHGGTGEAVGEELQGHGFLHLNESEERSPVRANLLAIPGDTAGLRSSAPSLGQRGSLWGLVTYPGATTPLGISWETSGRAHSEGVAAATEASPGPPFPALPLPGSASPKPLHVAYCGRDPPPRKLLSPECKI